MTLSAARKLLDQIAVDLSSGDPVFPVCFNITIKLRDLLRDPDVGMDKLAQVLQTEPIIATKLLNMANSAALAPSGATPVRELKGAILRLGLDAVKSVAFAEAIKQLARSKQMSGYAALSARIWEHSILVAAIARQLARFFKRSNPDEAFFAGLVHDIGAFYLLYSVSEESELSKDPEEMLSLLVTWHDGIGHALLDALGQQSEELLAAIQEHESPVPLERISGLGDILRAANVLAHRDAAWHPREADDDVLGQLFESDALEEILDASHADVEELRAILTV
jgi:HD-like signal output (HDOD) protein